MAQHPSRPIRYQWRVHPAREQKSKAVAAALVVLALLGCAAALLRDWVLVPAMALFLVGSLGQFFFPTRYLLDDEGISALSLLHDRRLAWRDLAQCECGERAAWLRPRRRSWWPGRGGLRVDFPTINSSAARRALEECRQRQAGDAAGRSTCD